jgi:hypothetical protein
MTSDSKQDSFPSGENHAHGPQRDIQWNDRSGWNLFLSIVSIKDLLSI